MADDVELKRFFDLGIFHANTPVRRLRGIGPVQEARMEEKKIRTLGDLVRAAARKRTRAAIVEMLSVITQNTRDNRCVTTAGPKVDVFRALNYQNNNDAAAEVKYHIGDNNSQGYAALLNLLRFVRARSILDAQDGNAPRRLHDFKASDAAALPALPAPPRKRGSAASYCSCFNTQRACNQYSVSCSWSSSGGIGGGGGGIGGGGRGSRGLCIPRRERIGFVGRDGIRGQFAPHGSTESFKNDGGSSYSGEWRRPGVVARMAWADDGNGDDDDDDDEDEDDESDEKQNIARDEYKGEYKEDVDHKEDDNKEEDEKDKDGEDDDDSEEWAGEHKRRPLRPPLRPRPQPHLDPQAGPRLDEKQEEEEKKDEEEKPHERRPRVPPPPPPLPPRPRLPRRARGDLDVAPLPRPVRIPPRRNRRLHQELNPPDVVVPPRPHLPRRARGDVIVPPPPLIPPPLPPPLNRPRRGAAAAEAAALLPPRPRLPRRARGDYS